MSDQAWVTLATNDSYSLGAMVLGTSLRRVNTTRQLAVMVTPGVSPHMRAVLEFLFNLVVEVNVLDSEDTANLALLTRPELGITFTKLHCWRLVQFTKCVFLDADTLVLQNCDELFDREEFSAAPDAGWPDCFNSGVFVFKPSLETYASLLQFAVECGSFDGGDQGLLNSFFSDWSVSDISRHLPFIYNMVASAVYSYLPAYRVFGQNVRIAHFIGPEKPWLQQFDTETGQVRPPFGQDHLKELLQAWWDIFRADIHLRLSPEMNNESSATEMEQKGLAGAFAKMSFEGPSSSEQQEYVNVMRKHDWESGRIDYLGQDSFDNILKKIQDSVAKGAEAKLRAKSPSPPKATPQPEPAAAPSAPPTEPTPPTPVVEPEPVAVPVTQAESPPVETSVPPPQIPSDVPAAVTPETVPVSESAPSQPAPVPEPVVQVAEPTGQAPAAPEPTGQPPAAPELTGQAPAAPEPTGQAPAAPEPTGLAPAAPEPTGQAPAAPEPTGQAPAAPKPAGQPPAAPEIVPTSPPAEPVPAAVSTPTSEVPVVEKTAEELEDARLAQERAAVEKKLAEQKIIAEQKLQEERAAADAAIAAAAAASTGTAPPAEAAAKEAAKPTGAAAAAPSGIPQPKAPPRKQAPSKARTPTQKLGYGIGIGMMVVAVAVGTFFTGFGSGVLDSFNMR